MSNKKEQSHQSVGHNFYNADLRQDFKEILAAYKESGNNPKFSEYDNGWDENSQKLTGYAIDFEDLDKSYLYSSEFEAKKDFDDLMRLLLVDYFKTDKEQVGHTPGENFLFEAVDRTYKYLFAMGHFTSPRNEARIVENLLIQARVQALEQQQTLSDLLQALKDLVHGMNVGMGKKAMWLRFELAQEAINKATKQ